VKPDDKEEDVAVKVADLLGAMPDRTIECSGSASAVSLAIHVRMDTADDVYVIYNYRNSNK
jgi:hypothetical protein